MSGSGMDHFEWAKLAVRNMNESSYREARAVFSRESEFGNPEADYFLGLMNARGQGARKNHAEAYRLLSKAYDGGITSAGYYLGKMCLNGIGTAKDTAKAVEYFQSVASFDARAMYEIGFLYFDGKEVPRDLERSAEWLTMAAQGGHLEAQFILGQMYRTGAGVSKDMAVAVRWLTSAALHGHKGAMILLGNMYRNGDGVDVDLDESDRWYDMAKERDDRFFRSISEYLLNGSGGTSQGRIWSIYHDTSCHLPFLNPECGNLPTSVNPILRWNLTLAMLDDVMHPYRHTMFWRLRISNNSL